MVAFAPALADGYGADRVLHLAAWQEYVLEFSDVETAQRALARLQSDPDVTDCFLDEAVTADDTLAGLWDETASRSWGGHAMGLTTLRHQADVLLPAGARPSPSSTRGPTVRTRCSRAACRRAAMILPMPRPM